VILAATLSEQELLDALARTGERSDLVPGAHLAALAIERGLILCPADGYFARFSELGWENRVACEVLGP
jgi:hypothetical protein